MTVLLADRVTEMAQTLHLQGTKRLVDSCIPQR